jgi:DNA-binding SARP family transcriptional activator
VFRRSLRWKQTAPTADPSPVGPSFPRYSDPRPAVVTTRLEDSISTTLRQLDRRVRELADVVHSQQTSLIELRHRLETLAATPGDHGDGRRTDGPEWIRDRRADLHGFLFGAFEVYLNGSPVGPWRSQKAASMLKYFLLNADRTSRRETLMDVFWPCSSPKSARNNLNVTLYQLRGVLREHDPNHTYVVFRDGAYELDPLLGCWLDVREYVDLVARGRQCAEAGDSSAAVSAFEQARSLYRGPLLDGDSSGEWFVDAQRRFQEEHAAVLEGLGLLLFQRGDIRRGLARAEDALGLDPCRENAHQLVMRAYAALEQPQLVVRQYRRCVEALERELAVAPNLTTTALYRQLVPTAESGRATGIGR